MRRAKPVPLSKESAAMLAAGIASAKSGIVYDLGPYPFNRKPRKVKRP